MKTARVEQLGMALGDVDDGVFCMHWDDFRSCCMLHILVYKPHNFVLSCGSKEFSRIDMSEGFLRYLPERVLERRSAAELMEEGLEKDLALANAAADAHGCAKQVCGFIEAARCGGLSQWHRNPKCDTHRSFLRSCPLSCVAQVQDEVSSAHRSDDRPQPTNNEVSGRGRGHLFPHVWSLVACSQQEFHHS